MQKMLRVLGDRRAALQNGEETQKGFTLIELLVVVIIIGILAGIAIPVFLNQRESAWRAELESDVKNAALAAETLAVQDGGSYSSLPATAAELEGFNPSNSNSSFAITIVDGGSNFEILASHPDLDETLLYDTEDGGLQPWSE